MISHRQRGVTLLHYSLAAIGVELLFWFWVLLNFQVIRSGHLPYTQYGIYGSLIALGLAVDFVISQVFGLDLLRLRAIGVLRLSVRQAATILLGFLLFLVALKDVSVSRIFLFSFLPVLFGALVAINHVLPRLLTPILFHSKRRERTLLIGSVGRVKKIEPWIQSNSAYGLDVVGILDDHPHPRRAASWPVLGDTSAFEEVAAEHGITQVLALSPNSVESVESTARACERLGLRFLIVNDHQKQELPRRTLSKPAEAGFTVVSIRDEPLECPLNRVIKRSVDILLSLPVVLFVLPPVAICVHLAHRLQSPGPLVFSQRRTGLRSREFLIYKFRTMHLNCLSEELQATEGDPRIFPAGRWLRKLSLDELLQFVNVLQGDMSIVGPRPHIPAHDRTFEKVSSSYRIRSLIKPGITGLAQVEGWRGEAHSDRDIIERSRSDVYYVEHWSFLLDWKIMLRTAVQMVIPPRSAY